MDLADEILTDLDALLAEHGVTVRWKAIDLPALVSRLRNDQQIDIGGMIESPELSVRVAKEGFLDGLPKFGERIEVDGTQYRITKVGSHPRSPLITLTLSTTDE